MGLGEVDAEAGPVTAERVGILGRVARGHARAVGTCGIGHEVERREANADRELGRTTADALDHGAQEQRAPRQVAAVPPRAVVTAEKFVQEVAVAVLDVDEVEPGLVGEDRGVDVARGEFVELVVGEQLGVAGADAFVEKGVAVRDTRRGHAVGSGPATGVGELQSADLVRVRG